MIVFLCNFSSIPFKPEKIISLKMLPNVLSMVLLHYEIKNAWLELTNRQIIANKFTSVFLMTEIINTVSVLGAVGKFVMLLFMMCFYKL